MNKTIIVVSIALAAVIATGAYTLWRVGGHFSSVQPDAAPAARALDAAPAPAAQREPAPAPAVSSAAPVASVAAAELSPDERSPFGHVAGEEAQNGAVEFAEAETADAANLPTAREAEDAVLEDARATLQILLENPDPDVRSEAAAILDRIDSRPR
jgi:hypothetical protein